MADLAITAADVQKGSASSETSGTAGGTITAGMPVYKSSAGQILAALADTAEHAAVIGVATNSASSGQTVSYVTRGSLTVSTVLTIGTVYVLSATSGKIAPVADLGSGDFVTILGVATTTSSLAVGINASGIAIA